VSDQEVSPADLRKYLHESLPEYMVPAHFVRVSTIPLNGNGKVDRNALLNQADAFLTARVVRQGPRNETEAFIAAVWRDLLEKENIGVNDNFFEIGGHSLKATQMLLQLNNHFNVKLDLRKFFLNPTIESLSLETRRINWISAAPVSAEDDAEYNELII
jgi:acyl carrier protein